MAQQSKPAINNPVTLDGHPLPYFPIGDRVFAERQSEDDIQMACGLVIPGRSANALSYGTILAAGPQALDVLHDAGIAVGDRVMWGRYAGDPLQWRTEKGSHEIHVINVKDIWGSAELREAIADGRVGITNINADDGSKPTEHRFMLPVETSDLVKQPDGTFVARETERVVPTRDELQAELKTLDADHRRAHMRQDVDAMEAIESQRVTIKKHLKILEAQD